MEVANEWSCAVNSNYQLDRMRNCFTACFLIKAACQSLQTNHLTLSAVTKVSTIMENYSNSKLVQTSESREVTGTGDDYS